MAAGDHDVRGRAPIGGLRVVHHGDDELVVLKPAGMSSELTGAEAGDAALERVRHGAGWPEARLPHRLDRLTRGFLLIARDSVAARRHSEAIRAGSWTKGYFARLEVGKCARDQFVPGSAPSLSGSHRRYVRRRGRRAECVRAGGDPAHLDILATAPSTSHRGQIHVAIRLVTGRFHQIRVMCADLGFPLAGDVLYGGTAALGEPFLEHALFRFPGAQGRMITLFDPNDPEREVVARNVIESLSAI